MSVFYEKFERHAHGEGLKGRATHYCPGCGHGLAHKYLADAIEELGIQDRTVAISPVGCSVFLYYYFDVGNSQAAHGRAPGGRARAQAREPRGGRHLATRATGTSRRSASPRSSGRRRSACRSPSIFVNNAIYGMTGGQMAPTTLMGQKTATSPYGRDRSTGPPMKMAELVSQLEAPVYVERVALFDAKQRIRAQKAILKGLRNQVEGRGFSFVEVLAECPTHLKMTPQETEKWVKEQMLPVFPLGVKKDVVAEPWFRMKPPVFDPKKVAEIVGGSEEERPRYALGFPSHLNAHDVSLKLAGSGGDGAQTAAMLISVAAINEGFDATHIPSYGPESRGGTSYADVHVAAEEVLSPAAPKPDILIAFNAPSLVKFGPAVPAGRDDPLRQLGRVPGPGARPAREGPRRAVHRDRGDPGEGRRQEHRGARGAPGRHEPLPAGDVPDGRPRGAQGKGRARPAERGRVRRRDEGARAGDDVTGRREAMSDGKVTVSLTGEEWKLVSALRAIPPSLLREKTMAAVEALVDYAREPKCCRDAGGRRPLRDRHRALRAVPSRHLAGRQPEAADARGPEADRRLQLSQLLHGRPGPIRASLTEGG